MSRKILLKSLPTTEPNRFLEVEVYYEEGGMSFLSGSFNKRGFYLAVQPVKMEGCFKSMTAFSGTKALVEEAKRFSARKLQDVAIQALQLPIYRKLLDHVLAKGDIHLEDEAPKTVEPAETPAENLTLPEEQPGPNRGREAQVLNSAV
jgi:hypothetical protein